MGSHEKAKFRITPWPAMPLPHPGLGPPLDYRLDRATGAVLWTGRALEARAPASDGEAYLRLAALDLADLDAIERWLTSYGILEVGYGGWTRRPADYDIRGFTLHKGWHAVRERLWSEWWRCHDAPRPPDTELVETLAEFRWGASCIKDLVTAWRVLCGEIRLEEAAWVAPIWDEPPERLETYPWDTYTSADGFEHDGPALLLSLYVTKGLQPFTPRLLTESEQTYMPTPFSGADTSLYELCCLELYNHIVQQTGYRSCANEKCQRLFVHQSGRAQHGQHRSHGVLYCSAECARAQAQRAYRRRKAAARPSQS